MAAEANSGPPGGIPFDVINPPKKCQETSDNQETSDYQYSKDDKLALDVDNLQSLKIIFGKYNLPETQIAKLVALIDYELYFIIDDSGSMASRSSITNISDWMQNKIENKSVSRWQVCQNNIHLLIDILAYIPISSIKFTFLNNSQVFDIKRLEGQTIEAFRVYFHEQVELMFKTFIGGPTPLCAALTKANSSNIKRLLYIFTDGQPSDGPITTFTDILKKNNFPLMFVNLSDDDCRSIEYIEDIVETIPNCFLMDDHVSLIETVKLGHGRYVPFTIGTWLLCILVGAITPDLDNLFGDVPLKKSALSNVRGYKIPDLEYLEYWQQHPFSRRYSSKYNTFLSS